MIFTVRILYTEFSELQVDRFFRKAFFFCSFISNFAINAGVDRWLIIVRRRLQLLLLLLLLLLVNKCR